MIQALSFFRILKNPKVILGFVVIAAGAYIWYTFEKVDSLEIEINQKNERISELSLSNERLSNSIEGYQLQLEQEVEKQRELNRRISEIRQDLRNTESQLNRAMGRQETVFAKPELVERMLRRSWRKFNEEVSCLSGEESSCVEEQQEQ